MNKEKRILEIKRAVRLVGWFEVRNRITKVEDLKLFDELFKEQEAKQKADHDKLLKRNRINF